MGTEHPDYIERFDKATAGQSIKHRGQKQLSAS